MEYQVYKQNLIYYTRKTLLELSFKNEIKQQFDKSSLVWNNLLTCLRFAKILRQIQARKFSFKNTTLCSNMYSLAVCYVSLPQKCNFTFPAIWYCSLGKPAAVPNRVSKVVVDHDKLLTQWRYCTHATITCSWLETALDLKPLLNTNCT